jgi:hypothetical protein
MELKDVILSTLAEMEEETPTQAVTSNEPEIEEEFVDNEDTTDHVDEDKQSNSSSVDSELMYLNSIRERLLVLFEGFQAPNNSNIEAKIDMTLNFLEYTLATIDARVEKLEKGNIS